MALWECLGPDCGTHYAVGSPKCPQCGCVEFEEVGAVPKITKAEGPTSVHDPDLPPYPVEKPVEPSSERPTEPAGEPASEQETPTITTTTTTDPEPEPEPESTPDDGAAPDTDTGVEYTTTRASRRRR